MNTDSDVNVDSDLLMLLKSTGIGGGEPDLGEQLLRAFLSQLLEGDRLPARIVCLNTGIFLTTAGSVAGELLQQFEQRGSEILSCGTCLDYYGRKDRLRIGRPTNMKETVEAMLSFKTVLQP